MRYPLLLLLATLASAADPAWMTRETRFPDDAGLSVRTLGATGDGVTDDTAAFQKAFDHEPKAGLILVPAGTYLISDTIRWGKGEKRQVLQGEGPHRSVIVLKAGSAGFQDAAKPKAMFWTGNAPAQRFRNGVRGLTLDIGTGNRGAIGLQFIANNQGGVQDVVIRDPAGVGQIGLDLGYTKEQGPCLIKNVRVHGFARGVTAKGSADSITFEGLILEGQREVGIHNDGQVISLRHVTSRNAVPALLNLGDSSMATIVDSTLEGTGSASGIAAITNSAGLFLRQVRTPGYARAADNSTGSKLPAAGPEVAEYTSHEVVSLFPSRTTSLNLPVLETPVIPWDKPEDWVAVTKYQPVTRAVKDLVSGADQQIEDWAPALQAAIDAGARTIYFPRRAAYAVFGTVVLRNQVRRIIGCENAMLRVIPEDKDLGKVKDQTELDEGADSAVSRFGPQGRPIFVCADGDAPAVVVERFESWYGLIRFEQRSAKRSLVIGSLPAHDIAVAAGTAPVFIEDIRVRELDIATGGSVYARQMNPEGHAEPRTHNVGGLFWILGIKTEADNTIHTVEQGGRSEIVGGFIYANKDSLPVKQMFIVRDAEMSFTIGESVMRQAPFDPVEETRGGETRRLRKGQAPKRGKGGALIPLFVAAPR